jgi:hypothetical protein
MIVKAIENVVNHHQLDSLASRSFSIDRHRWVAAVHESGHVVAAMLFGIAVLRVEINHSGGGSTYFPRRLDPIARLPINIAGMSAELEFLGVTILQASAGAAFDLCQIDQLLRRSWLTSDRFWSELTSMRHKLGCYSDSLKLIASALWQAFELSGSEAAELFRRGVAMP